MIAPDARLLGLLLAIAKYGSFNRAAAALNMSQPALSVKIAQLEHQVGVSVFARGPSGASLTEYGELLLHFAQTIETVRERAIYELRMRQLGASGSLIIGTTAIALSKLIPEALGQLDSEVEHLTVQIVEGHDPELNDQLRRREIDIMVGVVGFEADQPGIQETTLLKDRLDLVLRPGTDLDRCKEITLQKLSSNRWILPEKGTYFQHQIESLFIVSSLPYPKSALFTRSMFATSQMAMNSNRVAILPRLAVRQEVKDGLLAAIPISGPGTIRKIGYRLRDSEIPLPVCQRFIDLLWDVAKRIEKSWE